MWGILPVFVALCVVGVSPQPSESGKEALHWCSTMCMCRYETQVAVRCFEPSEMYEFLGISKKIAMKMAKHNWTLDAKVYWCKDLCLCHSDNNREFQCVEEDDITYLITDYIGDMYFYHTVQQLVEEERHMEERTVTREETEAAENRRSERKKKKKDQKPRKNVRTTEAPAPEPEPEPTLKQVSLPTTTSTTTTTTTTTPSTTITTTLTTTPSQPVQLPSRMNDPAIEQPEAGEAELLPKQEAVAASPAVTAMQPPTRRQPFPPTATAYIPHASTREVITTPPKVSAVLEVPVERKTVASEVSQDLTELGSTVLEIRNDVVLNQRILFVTVVIASIAMLGVLILAVHGCNRRRRPPPDAAKKRDATKDDKHTKMNLEEAW
ncbi:probable serine/threonine-protein kinase irlD [Cherax quadricarinatus]|uniref:probable serine/threonine-protein kinase irlD n=1 Tax=Cherax quadricarinatus TaxID=27406 RepID=UPI002377F81D|nr:probable serine/threonine-protein kinase irlD [Cherax quadricarinatus]